MMWAAMSCFSAESKVKKLSDQLSPPTMFENAVSVWLGCKNDTWCSSLTSTVCPRVSLWVLDMSFAACLDHQEFEILLYQQRKENLRNQWVHHWNHSAWLCWLCRTLLSAELVLEHVCLGFGQVPFTDGNEGNEVLCHRTSHTNRRGLLVTELRHKEELAVFNSSLGFPFFFCRARSDTMKIYLGLYSHRKSKKV